MGNKQNKGGKNVEVDASIKKRKEEMEREIKILLLGSGESGKSTIFKQIKILRNKGFDPEETLRIKGNILASIAVNMGRLVRGAVEANSDFAPENTERVMRMRNVDERTTFAEDFEEQFRNSLADDISVLWKEPAVKQAFERKADYHIDDGFEYFMLDFNRIIDSEYVPTQDDILSVRVKTVGIVEMTFEYQGFTFRVIDVGGQRNERRKWLHHFEGVTSILYVTALSDYNQMCIEDDKTNRMVESLNLFESITTNPIFSKTPMIIFFNKTDLFREKIEKFPLAVQFSDYTGGNNYNKACQYIKEKFCAKVKSKKLCYPHFTCARDTNQIETVVKEVEDIILKQNLQASGLM